MPQAEFYPHQVASVSDLIPYALNSRTHSDEQVAQLAASIREFGFTNPVLIDESNNLIAGHGRLLAARKLQMETVPAIVVTGLDDRRRRALVIADNKLALNAEWDQDALSVELEDLAGDFGELMGFSDDELVALLKQEATEGLTDEDAVPEAPEQPTTVEGDVWVLGKHRLMCGDSTSIDAVEKLMNGQLADMVFTDPPYGMSYGGGRARGNHALNEKGGVLIKSHGMIKGDDLEGENLIQLVRDALSASVSASKQGSAYYICFTWRTYSEFESAIEDSGLSVNNCIVWDKKSIGLGNANYRPQHEFIFYVKGGSWHGNKSESDVWYMSRGATGEYVHPTQKPVELIERAIENSSKQGDSVLDVFGGSGSTLIACQKQNRDCRMMELDPKYCDVIINRWQDFTGEQAVHEESGKTFFELDNAEPQKISA